VPNADIGSQTLKTMDALNARRQLDGELKKGNAFEARVYQYIFAGLIDAMYGKNVLGEINSNSYDCHDFPFQKS
jgi:hypothetical protein